VEEAKAVVAGLEDEQHETKRGEEGGGSQVDQVQAVEGQEADDVALEAGDSATPGAKSQALSELDIELKRAQGQLKEAEALLAWCRASHGGASATTTGGS